MKSICSIPGVIVSIVIVMLTQPSTLVAQVGDPTPAIEIETGVVLGKIEGSTRVFRGIPYAAPPIGKLRWKAPQRAASWGGSSWEDSDELEAYKLGSMCPQGSGSGGNENCLTINVWTPSGEQSAPLPVMVWIHGGGFRFGSSRSSTYNGQALSEKGNVIIVSFNYRLGMFGFLALPELTNESPRGSSGVYGLLDQVAALEWVQRNISAFNGDPENVTIFGEDAGAMSVCQHLFSPKSKRLFHRAIMQSGTCFLPNSTYADRSMSDAYVMAQAFLEPARCSGADDVVACLRAIYTWELTKDVNSSASLPLGGPLFTSPEEAAWQPIYYLIDGDFLPYPIANGIIDDRVANVPIMMGTSLDESTALVGNFPVTEQDYIAAIHARYGKGAGQVAEVYPLTEYDSPATALAVMTSDEMFTCPTYESAKLLSRAGRDVYLYRTEQVLENLSNRWMGAFHTSDTAFVFGNDHTQARLGPEDRRFAQTVMSYWLKFSKTGNPNDEDLVFWPKVSSDAGNLMVLKEPVHVSTGAPRAKQCAFWRTFQDYGPNTD
jgi:para-nitrobenzyl esterase